MPRAIWLFRTFLGQSLGYPPFPLKIYLHAASMIINYLALEIVSIPQSVTCLLFPSSSIVNVNTAAPEYFSGLVQRHPVFPPYGRALYSNAAYRILAYVIEAITGKSYEAVLKEDVFEPLGLKHSSSIPPVRSGAGVIPDGDAGWSRPYGDEVA